MAINKTPLYRLCRICGQIAVLIVLTQQAPVNAVSFNEAELEKLFTIPAVRQKMDAARNGGVSTSSNTQRLGPNKVKVTGMVSRSDGKNVVWLNGKSTLENTMVDGVKVYPDSVDKKAGKVPVRVDGRLLYLKPGQSWQEETGRIVDSQ